MFQKLQRNFSLEKGLHSENLRPMGYNAVSNDK